MKTSKFLTSAFVLGSIALGTLGQAKEAAAITFLKNGTEISIDDTSWKAPDSDKTLLNAWLAKDAFSDQYHTGSDYHAFWLSGLGNNYDTDAYIWEGNSFFYEYEDGTANLTGIIQDEEGSDKKFKVDIWFNSTSGITPKKELNANNYVAYSSGVVETDTWNYYTIDVDNSFLIKQGEYTEESGNKLKLSDRSNTYKVQVGEGANGKNINMGLSAWFTDHQSFTHKSGPDVETWEDHSDINIDLVALQVQDQGSGYLSESTPEPATMSLLTLGLLGTGMGALKRKNK